MAPRGRGTARARARRRFWAAATTSLILAAAFVPGPATGGPNHDADRKLRPGDATFWKGENVDLAQVRDPGLCGVVGDCWEYGLDVAPGGARLRVSLAAHLQEQGQVRSWPDNVENAPEMIFTVQLIDPSGEIAAERSNQDPVNFIRGYALELFVQRPEAGVWTVRVIPTSVIEMAFRMRAKLETATIAKKEARVKALPPNMRIIPPFELNFNTSSATWRPGAGTPGVHASCMAEEVVEATEEGDPAPQLCLRYSIGLENVGRGPLWLMLKNVGGYTILTQRVLTTDGTSRDQREGGAGQARYHDFHLHYHYQNAYVVQLLAPAEPDWAPGDGRPRLIKVAPGRKLGFGPGNEYLADWKRFYQGLPQHYYDSGNGNDGDISIQTGWGDIYEWNRGGNYVDFPQVVPGVPQAGFYVLRGVTDALGLIVESDDTDNVSYAFFEVTDLGDVRLLERGYGTDPWDPDKVVLDIAP